MDREDLDKQLKENGMTQGRKEPSFRLGEKKLALLAAALIIAGSAGGCFFGGHFGKGNPDNGTHGTYTFPQTEQKQMQDLPTIRNTAVVQAVKEVGPAVVGITTKVYDRDIFNRRIGVGQSVGSGVIFDKQGYIVTNNHVVSGGIDVNVSLSSGVTVSGKVYVPGVPLSGFPFPK